MALNADESGRLAVLLDQHGEAGGDEGVEVGEEGEVVLGGLAEPEARVDRDRLGPLTDGMEDDQAVYVGTQIRF